MTPSPKKMGMFPQNCFLPSFLKMLFFRKNCQMKKYSKPHFPLKRLASFMGNEVTPYAIPYLTSSLTLSYISRYFTLPYITPTHLTHYLTSYLTLPYLNSSYALPYLTPYFIPYLTFDVKLGVTVPQTYNDSNTYRHATLTDTHRHGRHDDYDH